MARGFVGEHAAHASWICASASWVSAAEWGTKRISRPGIPIAILATASRSEAG